MEQPEQAIQRAAEQRARLETETNTYISQVNHEILTQVMLAFVAACLVIAGFLLFKQSAVPTTHLENVTHRNASTLHADSQDLENTISKDSVSTPINSDKNSNSNNQEIDINLVTSPEERTKQVESTLDTEVLNTDSTIENPVTESSINEDSVDQIPSDEIDSDEVVATVDDAINPFTKKPVIVKTNNSDEKNDIRKLCAEIGEKLGSVSTQNCLDYNFIHSGFSSTNDKALAYVDFVPKGADNQTNRVLLFGGIHGDEFSAVSIVFRWLSFLDSDKNNPFPTPDWEGKAIEAWKRRTGSNKRRYPGKYAASELETQWVLHLLENFEPDAIISVHAPFGIVDADGPVEPPQKLGPLELKLLFIKTYQCLLLN